MCGICGLVGRHPPAEALAPMMGLLRHRGPDGSGQWSDERAVLGHTRLAIVDLTDAGCQPMENEDGQLHLVANGEIYNSPELRDELAGLGHRFRSHSDNEVLLHLYEEEGPSFLARLNGMFALALWDARRARLILARDRMGIKPLYYHLRGDVLLFASEAKALLACPGADTGLSSLGLAQYLAYENTFGPTTLLRDVLMVEPGQCLIWEQGRIRPHYYWRPTVSELDSPPPFDDACARFRDIARRAVKRHLMSDVEVASYLSGGLDSTTVAALAAGAAPGRLATFTGTFGQGGWYDETPGALAMARTIDSRHHTVKMGHQDLAETMDDVIFHLDGPRMGMGAFSQYMVAREASKRFKVILTGHGGDELFAGYPVFKLIHLLRQLGGGKGGTLRALRNTHAEEWPHIVYFMSRRLACGGGEYLPTIFPRSLARRGLRPDVRELLLDQRPRQGLQDLVQQGADPYQQLCLIYLRAYLPGLFVVEDAISMAHSLESRTPLCDNELVDAALSWPLSLKLHDGTLKAIPKAAMRSMLPDVLYRQPKKGFPTPLALWLRGPLRQWARERLLEDGSPLHGLFRKEFLEKEFASYVASWRRAVRPLDVIPTHRLWALLSLEAWLRTSQDRLGRRLEL
jgi:asparagine synthase (glutamine-hydrolysing)